MSTQVDRGLASALPLMVISASLLVASPARADNTEGFDKQYDDSIAADKQARAETKEKASGGDTAGTKVNLDPTEDPSKRYFFVGLRFRDVIVPKFMMNIFGDGGATVNV